MIKKNILANKLKPLEIGVFLFYLLKKMETIIVKQEFDEQNREIYRELANGDYVRWWYSNDDWEKFEYNIESQVEVFETSLGTQIVEF